MILGPGDAPDRARMGGKACALAALGPTFPIPTWRVVTPETVLGDDDIVSSVLAELGPGPFAVRSSAVEEDQSTQSFAGQLCTFLNVRADELLIRMRAVRDSARSESVLAYRRLHGLPGLPPVPAVIVQQMVAAECAGVAFSVDPIDGRHVAVMATHGLAEELVSGKVNGDTYRLTRDGATVSVTLSGATAVVDDVQRKLVADLALRAEAHFGAPQDIEWAFARDELFLLQSRPITGLGDATLWDNSNIVESYSGVTAPLTFSFARHVYSQVYQAFCRVLGVSAQAIAHRKPAFDNLLGYVDQHVYYNLLNWYRILALLPGFDINRRFMEQMMGVSAALPEELANRLAPKAGGVAAWLRVGFCLVRLGVQAIRLPRTIAEFRHRLNAALDDCPPVGDLKTLASRYRQLETSLLDRWDAPLINDFLCMVAFGASRMLLRRWCGNDELHNDLMVGQGDIVSTEPIRRIRQMADMIRDDPALIAALRAGDLETAQTRPDLRAGIADYLRIFGDRCAQELKLESVTLHDDPTALLQAIGYTAGSHPARAPIRGSLRQALVGRPLRLAVATRVVAWARARVRDRENLRFERTRVFGRVRSLFLEMGRRLAAAGLLAQPRDVFYLEVGEVLGLIDGTATTNNPAGLAALRRETVAAAAPPNRFWTHGAVCLSRHRPSESAAPNESTCRQGLGCCPGRVRAKVRIIHDPRREAMRPGEILVARHTDPGWIALFSNAAGIVVERGSLLSHSAIVAREMNIPAVVAVPGLMEWLTTGDIVQMDGRLGTVTRICDDERG